MKKMTRKSFLSMQTLALFAKRMQGIVMKTPKHKKLCFVSDDEASSFVAKFNDESADNVSFMCGWYCLHIDIGKLLACI